jgi:hypothetical protein
MQAGSLWYRSGMLRQTEHLSGQKSEQPNVTTLIYGNILGFQNINTVPVALLCCLF